MYYIINKNKDSNGNNEIHNKTNGCSYMPNILNQVSLGWCSTDDDALEKAKAMGYTNADGCYYCCPNAHRG